MNYVVRIHTLAKADVIETALWYEAQLPGLGLEFMEEIREASLRLATHPEIHRVRFADVHRAPVHRFKFYGLYYLIQNTEVWVIAVHHERRHPNWLRTRRKRF